MGPTQTDTSDAAAWASALDVPEEAVELYRRCDVIDLHIDSFIWSRILGYDLRARHRWTPTGRRYLGQVDIPRALDANLTGGMWSITTNPFRPASARRRAFTKNLTRLKSVLDSDDRVSRVRNVAEYRAARAEGRHGAFIAIQGGNALSAVSDLDLCQGDVVRITLVHMTTSAWGETSSPFNRLSRIRGLTDLGREFVTGCNEKRILVDLAHISPQGFWDAVEVHDPSQPLIVTHTGVNAVKQIWRNLDDDQIRAVADSGGCVGVILHELFLGGDPPTVEDFADHVEHLANVGGADLPAIGTDLDGMVTPPSDLRGHAHLPRLVAVLLRRGWDTDRIRKVLAGNALRTISALRG
ncbi:MAG: hypothetical protein JJLCMIEE_02732 [Acidimicrobiales bacterium]|nr:MAG: hypothetical protein EDR02_14540 [Actinomycetota bacterium]MBV6509636.1 hypothetical protein [Acidimicrobiales bacterium]RIK06330.1 MAG: hypothetical protein DCC48_07865 [Acidobacteriota bacterium]